MFKNIIPDILSGKFVNEEEPLRAELYSMLQMEQHGKDLAGSHILSSGGTSVYLLKRLAENQEILYLARTLLTDAVKLNLHLEPAAEWLLDNLYVIEEQIRIARKHLPKSYSRELPHLKNGSSEGLPRVYDLAIDTISYGDGRVDPESLSSFIAAYQTVSPLKIGELWAIPIMLRLALIENLRRLAARIAYHRKNRNLANYWADRMSESAEKDPKNLILVIADMTRSGVPLVSSFIAELTRRLQGHGPTLMLPLTWIEQRLTETGQTIHQVIQQETQKQAIDQVSVSNSITSLRFLGAMDWKEFVETMSIVEQTLRKDISGIYSRMDFNTRDNYRHVIEKIAKHSTLEENDVANEAIRLANEASENKGIEDKSAHVGYYLIDKGLAKLENTVKVKLSFADRWRKFCYRFPLILYAGTIFIITAGLTCIMLLIYQLSEISFQNLDWIFWVTGIAAFISVSNLGVALVNWWVTIFMPPKRLPRLNFTDGIPSEFRTLVVVPTMLNSEKNIESLVNALEVRFLANRDESLHFCLLTDFLDAPEESMPEDNDLLTFVKEKIEQLNKLYPRQIGDPFFLFHRPRKWNPKENCWMGYERKRGKLQELNSFILRGELDKFSFIVGDTTVLSNVKFIITLDTDTQLPRDSSWQLVGTMAHPLNRPKYDETKRRITEGYGILQPLVSVCLPSTNQSLYAQISGSEPGIDPYTRAVSDVYQDMFGEGSFIGKGIFDVEAFDKSLNKRFPENRILSHDLLEGCYARSGFLSDIQLFEEYPGSYFEDVSRRARWIRGDWQIAKWLLPKVPLTTGKSERNPLSGLSIWKITDNLRRSLEPLAMTTLLFMSWSVLHYALLWTLLVFGVIFIPTLLAIISETLHKPEDIILKHHLISTIKSAGKRIAQAAFTFVCLPYEAYYSIRAILKTMWRIIFTHKMLLEWNPSGNFQFTIFNVKFKSKSILSFFSQMWFAPAITVAGYFFLAFIRPEILFLAGPILIFWLISPFISWSLSQPFVILKARLSKNQKTFLRKIARKTWAFFETFVGEEDNWLPPDNYQEQPVEVVAHRTSPTNMGISLLANMSAYDFGYITAGQLIERTKKTYHTMNSMERYRGHFYNWYDTKTLNPLLPLYISTVDSGNFAGHVLTLRQGMLTIPDEKIFRPQFFKGLRDTLWIFKDISIKMNITETDELENEIDRLIKFMPDSLSEIKQSLDKLSTLSSSIALKLDSVAKTDTNQWANAIARQCEEALNELIDLAPWVELFNSEIRNSESGTANELQKLEEIPTINDIINFEETILPFISQKLKENNNLNAQFSALHSQITSAIDRANERKSEIDIIEQQSVGFSDIDYDFLYDKSRHLFVIGFNVDEHRKDGSNYDLLASEVRLCSFLAIAQGKIPQESWFSLGRQITTTSGEPTLLSWSGSMFEYLMPLLVMPTYENTLLDQSNKASVKRQIEYGRQSGVPWGISESCYNSVDVRLNYQYRAFGVPGLGFKRGLADDLVIAPYASGLALMVDPENACENLQRLTADGFEGNYGFYEAIDYTPARLPAGQSSALVQSFMTHHQGMILLSLNHVLLSRLMQKRFATDPQVQATLLLLQERIPRSIVYYSQSPELSETRTTLVETGMPMRIIKTPDTPIPELQLLSNGKYHVMITNSGGGYSLWDNLAITRWREDSTSDNRGSFCFIKDTATEEIWSNTYQPTLNQPKNYEVIFSMGRAEFRRRGNNFDTHTEIVVSPEDDIELRRVRIINRTRATRTIVVTTYAEVVLAPLQADENHPAFSNLFIQTEILDKHKAIICKRRPRSADEKTPTMFHLMSVHGAETSEYTYETDRMQFIGRGNSIAEPNGVFHAALLSDTQGSVLDPIVAIQCLIILKPEDSVIVDIVTGIGETHDNCLQLIEKYKDQRLADRVIELAWTHSQVTLRNINATESDAQLYSRLASSIVYTNSALRAEPGIIIKNQRGQSGLWSYSISGDLPIVLLLVEDTANISLVQQMVQAHAYWRLKGLSVDLVIINEDHSGYRQLLHDQILGIIAGSLEANLIDKKGGIYVRTGEQISNEDRILFQTVARVIISDKLGSLIEQVKRKSKTKTPTPLLKPSRSYTEEIKQTVKTPKSDLLFYNGFGGFTHDGREYIINSRRGKMTPTPWVNILSNPHFGSVVSESGSVYTWFENAHEMRLTPWSNDPVSDLKGEAFYIRDEETGHYWSPTPLPATSSEPYTSRHGFGYSVFEHSEDGIKTEIWIYVAIDAPVKFTVVKVSNESGRHRRLSATGYVEWVLGELRTKTNMHLVTEIDQNSGAIFAKNPYRTDFNKYTAFFDVDDTNRTITCDRTEFLGRNNTPHRPDAMLKSHLSGKYGAAMDPCSAIQVKFDLAAGQEREIIFRLGAEEDANRASNVVKQSRGAGTARKALEKVWEYWKHTLGAVQVETPDASINILVNGWLLYQTLSSRFWARTGFYQSSGAIGFRDQLQDSMALIYAEPSIMREHLLICASRQFVEGDVQHWWHPLTGRGVRTLCSDDYLWLPLVTSRYVLVTGDTGILDENIHYLEGRMLNTDEDSYFDIPVRSGKYTSLYDHCVKAIKKGLIFGEHGLPLIGSGDWNDGMNLVGIHGKGESVWLGFFLFEVLNQFSKISELSGDTGFTEICRNEAEKLRANLDKHAWDGEWYKRAFFDNGTVLGSKNNTECRIDSIAQSWAVLSEAGDKDRNRIAMNSLDKNLVRKDYKLIELLEPPFDKSESNPGYIKGYSPGVRENGGQYTHAAVWAIMAFARIGEGRHAWELLNMINPINHGNSPEAIDIYKVEPYVVAADVYAVPPHAGRGGWTWYTGSAAWMYRLIVESLLGLKIEADKLQIDPSFPEKWESFIFHYRYRETHYKITILKLSSINDQRSTINDQRITVDGIKQTDNVIHLVDDRIEHVAEVKIYVNSKN